MSRDKDYQQLLNSKRWKDIRQAYLQAHPLCERCQELGRAAGLRNGYVTSAIDVHHKTPVETARNRAEMEALCYNWHNLQALCIPCHIKVHQEARSHSREAHQQRRAERLERWKARNECRSKPADAPTPAEAGAETSADTH